MKKIGIVGLGLKNPYTYAPLIKEKGAQVVAVYDTYPEQVREYARTFGCAEIYDIQNYPLVDGVIVCGINSQHIELATFFLNRGIPVYIEKPLAHSVDSALEFIERHQGQCWYSASPLRFSPVYTQMVADIKNGGEDLQYCRVSVFHTMDHFIHDHSRRWHDDPNKGGGILIDIGIHAIELLNMVVPEKPIASVSYSTGSSHYLDSISNDNHHVIIRYEDGTFASITLLCATSYLDYSIEAFTLNQRYANVNEQPYLRGNWTAENAYGGFERTIDNFLKMVETNEPPIFWQETKRNFMLLKTITEKGVST